MLFHVNYYVLHNTASTTANLKQLKNKIV